MTPIDGRNPTEAEIREAAESAWKAVGWHVGDAITGVLVEAQDLLWGGGAEGDQDESVNLATEIVVVAATAAARGAFVETFVASITDAGSDLLRP
jgi:hypothetical protein